MKFNKIFALAAGLLSVSLPSLAVVPQDGVYLNAQGGYVYVPNVSGRGYTTTFYNNFTSFDLAGGFGYKRGPMRYEGQFNFIQAHQQSSRFNGVRSSLTTSASIYALMGNVYFDFDMLDFPVVPYVGAGIGWADVYASRPNNIATSDNMFAYQAMGGLRYAFSKTMSLDASYRYFGTTTASNTYGAILQAQLINLGFTYNFG